MIRSHRSLQVMYIFCPVADVNIANYQLYSGEGKSPGILFLAAGAAWVSTLAISMSISQTSTDSSLSPDRYERQTGLLIQWSHSSNNARCDKYRKYMHVALVLALTPGHPIVKLLETGDQD